MDLARREQLERAVADARRDAAVATRRLAAAEADLVAFMQGVDMSDELMWTD